MGGFFPGKKYGGPPVSVDNFCSLMEGNAECYIVTHNHDMGETEPYPNIYQGWNDRRNAQVLYLTDAEYGYNTFEKIVNEIKPDYIYLQGLLQQCVLPCLKIAKKHNIQVVLAPRGELCVGAFKKKYKKIPYIVALKIMRVLSDVIFQSTSDEETKAIRKYLGASEDSICKLTNIPSIPHNLKKRYFKERGKGKIVFISRILWKKNLLKAIHFLSTVKGTVVFDIYGPKEDTNYWMECEKAINVLSPNIKVEYKGILSHDEIHQTLNQYDAFLFPTLSENYGHVIAEALVTGCIPIISDQTPWSDINEADAGWALPLDNESAFSDSIQVVVDMDEDSISAKRKCIEVYVKQKLRIEDIKRDYLSVFK